MSMIKWMPGLLVGLVCSTYSGDCLSADAPGRSTVVGRYLLDLDGSPAGGLNEVGGGAPWAAVVEDGSGKHLSPVQYEDITLLVGSGISKPFYEWVVGSINNPSSAKKTNGAIITASPDNKEVSRLTWTEGSISTLIFPALVARSTEAAKLLLMITPQQTQRVVAASGAVVSGRPGVAITRGRQWTASTFRLQIPGLESALARVLRIEPISIDFRQRSDGIRDVVVSNLTLVVDESAAASLYAWHEEFAVRGNSKRERMATLDYLCSDQSTMFRLTLRNLGIAKCSPAVADEKTGVVGVRAEMYVEGVSVELGTSIGP